MKNTLALVALAASLGEVTATFRHVKPFTCPDGINNSCFDKQKSGFDFGDLIPGKFDKYNDFDFKGWTCETKSTKKIIKGECGSSKEESPSFGHPENPFSVDHLDVTPEIDTDLEFHYDMPDGSNCKQRSFCSKQGSSIKNSQCGGAKKVTIVYPPNKKHLKNKCKIDIGKIGFGCDKTKFPPPPVVVPPPAPPAPSTLSTVFSSPPVPTLPVETPEVPPPQETEPVVETPEVPQETEPVETPEIPTAPQESSVLIPSETLPVPVETPFVPPQESEAVSSPVPVASEPAESLPIESVPAVSSVVVESTTSEAIPVISEPPVVETTVFQSTSTIFTTSVETVTDCGPEKPECGGQVTDVVVTVTVPLTTTVCDVTETVTRPAIPSETPEEEKPEQPETPEQPEQPETPNKPEQPETPNKPEQPETPNKPEQPETPNKPEQPETPEQPEQELPCDPVVPRCLVTWLPLVPDCKDNTDSKCFCPSKQFIEKVFECVYAHGESDEIIDKAVKFVQGICAEHVPENPAVVTGAESITEVLVIPTATVTPEGKYTTITLDTTLTVPCVEDGTTISASSTTTVVRATIEVPEVGFTTTASDIVPVIIPTAVPVQEGEGEGEGEGNNPTLVVAPPTVPVGTGGIPIPSSSGDFPAEAGAGKLTAGVTAAFAVMLAMAAF